MVKGCGMDIASVNIRKNILIKRPRTKTHTCSFGRYADISEPVQGSSVAQSVMGTIDIQHQRRWRRLIVLHSVSERLNRSPYLLIKFSQRATDCLLDYPQPEEVTSVQMPDKNIVELDRP